MATKRDLKKFIRNTCGALAAEIILARAAFPSIERAKVYDIVSDIAALQVNTLPKVSIAYDKKPTDFTNLAEYHKARHAYYATAYDHLLESFEAQVAEIVTKMNAALPEDVRATIKKSLAE